jgi:1-aminocyclopropane-1-carboxylate deaminase/D-cysteine desulfhydrase-like pyridoxal-dependent ACC family enzyme
MSGANEVGALGYLECAREIARQVEDGGLALDTLVIAAFSGGSQAGLLMGTQVAGLRADVVGVPVVHGAARVQEYVVATIDPRRFGSRVCFLHTGGLFGLFPFRSQLSRLLDGESPLDA